MAHGLHTYISENYTRAGFSLEVVIRHSHCLHMLYIAADSTSKQHCKSGMRGLATSGTYT